VSAAPPGAICLSLRGPSLHISIPRIACVPVLLTCIGLGLAAVPVSLFESKSPRGLDFVLQNSPTPQKYLIETMPGGVALFDYNNDGLLDVFLVNGGRVTSPMQTPENFDRGNPRYWNRLYQQNKDGSFTDVTGKSGLANAGDGNYGMGAAVGDYDNDGFPYLYLTSYGKNILYHNNGDGTFTDVTAKAGVAAGGWSVSAGFFDYDNDGKLDLFVTRYMEWDTKHSKSCGGEWHTYCPPEEFPATTSILYHNNGDGTFTDVSQKSGIAAKKGRALGVAFADYDGDGFTDIFVANDGMQQYLYRNNGNGTFTERALEAGAALSEDGRRLSGMGAVFQDYDNDGRPDVIVTELPESSMASTTMMATVHSVMEAWRPDWARFPAEARGGESAWKISTMTAGRIFLWRKVTSSITLSKSIPRFIIGSYPCWR